MRTGPTNVARLSARRRLLAAIFLIVGTLVMGEFISAVGVLRRSSGAVHVPFDVRIASRSFGDPQSPYDKWDILRIDGVPFRAAEQYVHLDERVHAGQNVTLTLRGPQGQIVEVVREAMAQPMRRSQYVSFAATYLFLPLFCLALGFGVAAIRPRDPLAWLLLALLASFAEAAHGGLWNGPGESIAQPLHTLLADSWAVWMMLFGIYFPTRLSVDEKLPWLKWITIAGITACTLFAAVPEFLWIHNIDASIPFWRTMVIALGAHMALAITAISTFFASMGYRSAKERDRDARRRIALLRAGASVSLTPILCLVVYAVFTDHDLSYFDGTVWLSFALGMLTIFPLTLAYVIVVQRAMNLRVALRSGIKYTLARGGLRLLRALSLGLLIFVLFGSRSQHKILLGLITSIPFFVLRKRVTRRATEWLDRKFFREAYNAERVLDELSEEARRFTEAGPLLETITRRIAATLHVPRATVLMPQGERFCIAAAAGIPDADTGCLPGDARAIEMVRASRKPAVVYFDDEHSWVHEIGREEKIRLQAFDAEVLLPLSGREDLAGIMILGPKLSEEPYSGNDLRLLQSVASQTGLALENCALLTRLSNEAARRERLNRELEIAREVQQRLFPQDCPAVQGIDYCGRCRPAQSIGGDYYDFIQLRSGRMGIAIGDVSGKGVAAALLMSNLHASLRGQTLAELSDLCALMRNVNQMIFEASTSNRYATFFYGEYCPAARRLDYVNAGHNAPMLLRGSECLRLEATGAVVGLLKTADYEQGTVQLQPGDLLVGFTDGISEAMTADEAEWEEERLLEKLRECETLSAARIIDAVFEGADAFTEGAVQYDDMTVVVLKLLPCL